MDPPIVYLTPMELLLGIMFSTFSILLFHRCGLGSLSFHDLNATKVSSIIN